MRSYDALVIGAGMSGLAAGIRVAQAGKRVLVLERHSLPGGLNSYYRRGGLRRDTGLHALTNFARSGASGAPLTRILRALRIRHGELELCEQRHSRIALPGVSLSFSNDTELLRSEVARAFPARRAAFDALCAEVEETPTREEPRTFVSARARLAERIGEPLLEEALLLPCLFYGSAREDDVDWETFAVLFRGLFLEGLARPRGGIKRLLDLLRERLREAGGELETRCGVRAISTRGGAAAGVWLESGEELAAGSVLSSAGLVETGRLLESGPLRAPAGRVGRISFFESACRLDAPPAELGLTEATLFFCASERVPYRRPDGPVEPRCGVLACPDNYPGSVDDAEARPVVRLSALASHAAWRALLPAEAGADRAPYEAAKRAAFAACASAVARFAPDLAPRVLELETFTPLTIERYTAHAEGAVYGSPDKRWDGTTGIEGLILIGTDQGYLGVVGALASGIAMANRHVIAPTLARSARA
jgi:phytoene dehydrogenase-like protein